VRLEGLGQLKKSTSSGLELATFRLVAKCLNQLRYRVPLNKISYKVLIEKPEGKNQVEDLGVEAMIVLNGS
jgi:hypothetical protein